MMLSPPCFTAEIMFSGVWIPSNVARCAKDKKFRNGFNKLDVLFHMFWYRSYEYAFWQTPKGPYEDSLIAAVFLKRITAQRSLLNETLSITLNLYSLEQSRRSCKFTNWVQTVPPTTHTPQYRTTLSKLWDFIVFPSISLSEALCELSDPGPHKRSLSRPKKKKKMYEMSLKV